MDKVKIIVLPAIDKPSDRKRIKKQYHLKNLDPCPTCNKYTKCQKLCLQAERYINQDEDPDHWDKIKPVAYIEQCNKKTQPNLSTSEIILCNYFIDRMEVKEIAILHYKSRQYVHRLIKKYTQLIIKNIKKSV
jgi:hypothetical protein